MKNKHLLILLSALLPLSLFIYLGFPELRAEEPRRAIVAMEMLLRKSYIIPQINGWDYFNKPPLFNWVLICFFKLTGSFSEWVVRLPGILSFLLIGILNFRITNRFINKGTAIYSTLFFLTSADIYFYGTMNSGEIDIFYSLITFAQAIFIYLFHEKRKFLLLFISSYFLTAIGILTKGAPSILFQGITLCIYLLLIKREWQAFFSLKHLAGIVLCSAIVCAYFYSYYLQGGDYKAYLTNLVNEASQKSGLESSFKGLISNIFIFPINLVKILFPWSLFMVMLIDRKIRKFISSNNYILFATVFVLANIPVYWFTEKLINRYVYMFFPFILTIIAYRVNDYAQQFPKSNSVIEKILSLAIILIPAGFFSLYFLAELFHIELFYWKVSTFTFFSLLILYLFFKTTLNRIYIVALAIVCLRFAMTIFYFPYIKSNSKISYRDMTAEFLELTNNQPILQGGSPCIFESEIALGPLQFTVDTLITAPLIAYGIPYYLTLQTNEIMKFEEQMTAGKFYLTYSIQVDTGKVKVLKKVEEGWQPNLELSLIKLR